MKLLKRFDEGLARGETALAMIFLGAMVLAASAQALFRNLARGEAEWARGVVAQLDWVDPFLWKATLCVALIGASLATRRGRHIAIDLLPRILPARPKLALRAITSLGASTVAFFVARAFWGAIVVMAREHSAYDIVGVHVCDASAAQLAAARTHAPAIFCGVRSAFGWFGVRLQTPQSALELLLPVLFVLIAVRLFATGVGAAIAVVTGRIEAEVADEPASAERT